MYWIIRQNQNESYELTHYGVKGMKWGVRKEYIPHPRKKDLRKYDWQKSKFTKDKLKSVSINNTSITNKKSKKLDVGKEQIIIALGIIGAISLTAAGVYAYKKYGKDLINSVDIYNLEKLYIPESKNTHVSIPALPESKNTHVSGLSKNLTNGDSVFIKNNWDIKEFPSVKERIKYFENKIFEESLYNSLSTNEQNAINLYTGEWYKSINQILRSSIENSKSNNRIAAELEVINNLRSALSKSITTEDMMVGRRVNLEGLSGLLGVKESEITIDKIKSLIGTRIRDDGFFSTTVDNLDSSIYKEFGEFRLQILVPKGSQGMYVAPVSDNYMESEFLLQSGTTFNISNVLTDSLGVITDVVLEVIDQTKF